MKRIAIPIKTSKKCHYGCGNVGKFVNGSNNIMCCDRSTKCPNVRFKNSEFAKKQNRLLPERRKQIYSSMSSESKKRMAWSKGIIVEPEFVLNGRGNHKAFLVKKRGHVCENCKLTKWFDEPIPLELEHVDGNNKNNVEKNLLLLCPNCHARTKFYRGRNINNGRTKVSDEILISEIRSGKPIRQILLSVGLTPKGANYERINKLKYNMAT